DGIVDVHEVDQVLAVAADRELALPRREREQPPRRDLPRRLVRAVRAEEPDVDVAADRLPALAEEPDVLLGRALRDRVPQAAGDAGETPPARPSYTAPDEKYTRWSTGHCSRKVTGASVFASRSQRGRPADAAGSPFAARYSAPSTCPAARAWARTASASVRSQRTTRTCASLSPATNASRPGERWATATISQSRGARSSTLCPMKPDAPVRSSRITPARRKDARRTTESCARCPPRARSSAGSRGASAPSRSTARADRLPGRDAA